MTRSTGRWLVALFALAAATYALAEEITVTTFYPSPRGVYRELRVGSGATTAPPAKLHVTLPTAETVPVFRADDQDGDLTPFIITDTGAVGIGTPAPATALHVRTPNTTILSESTSAAGGAEVRMKEGGGGDWLVKAIQANGGFKIRDQGAGQDRLTITNAGNVGIGITAPAYRLDVAGVLRLQPSGLPPAANGVMYYDSVQNKFRCYQNGLWIDCAGNLPTGTTGQTLRHDGTEWVATSNLFNNGTNIGIGTTTPATALHVRTPNTTILSESTSAAGGAEVRMKEGGGGDWLVKAIQANGGFKIRDQGAGQDRLTITNAGKVGIGTSTPGEKLDVVGNVHASGVAIPSDIRLKQHVMPLAQALARLDHIRGVAFEWNDRAKPLGHDAGEPDIGVIAQEVAAVFPELVSGGQGERYMAVDYGRLSAVLIEAVKELRSEQATLTRRIAELEQRLADVTKQAVAPAQDQGRR